jgi:hypothetical protein
MIAHNVRTIMLPWSDCGSLSKAGAGMIRREQPFSVLLFRKEKEDEHHAEQDGDDAGRT